MSLKIRRFMIRLLLGSRHTGHNNTLLGNAAFYKFEDVANVLLDTGCNINALNEDRSTEHDDRVYDLLYRLKEYPLNVQKYLDLQNYVSTVDMSRATPIEFRFPSLPEVTPSWRKQYGANRSRRRRRTCCRYLPAFAISLMMSLLFIRMVLTQGILGQSLTIACTKMIGTLFASVLFYSLYPRSLLLLIMYLLIFVLDVVYIILVRKQTITVMRSTKSKTLSLPYDEK